MGERRNKDTECKQTGTRFGRSPSSALMYFPDYNKRKIRGKQKWGQGESRLGEYVVGCTKFCGSKSVVCIEMHWVSLLFLLSICHCVSYLEIGTANPERASALSPSARHTYQQNWAM